jgi:hypothetical protein
MGCSHFNHMKPNTSRMRRLYNPCQQSPWVGPAGGFQTYVLEQQCASPAFRACPEEPSTTPYLTPTPSCSRFTARLPRHPALVIVRFHHVLLPAMKLVQCGLVTPGYLVQELRP